MTPQIDGYLIPSKPGDYDPNRTVLCGPCPYCHSWHFHGAEPGFRTAHCNDIDLQSRNVSRHNLNGYDITIVGTASSTLRCLARSYRDAVRQDRKRKLLHLINIELSHIRRTAA